MESYLTTSTGFTTGSLDSLRSLGMTVLKRHCSLACGLARNQCHMNIFTTPPNPIFFKIGSINIYWYGFLITTAIILGFLISLKLAQKYKIKKDVILDLYFWLIIFGIIGARLYHVACEWSYYSSHLIDIVKPWRGGLGIYGAIAAGLIVIWLYSKKIQAFKHSSIQATQRDKLWLLLDVLSPALILGLAIGRWGNFFNQELFGPACNYFWCIPIDLANRPLNLATQTHFHPTFLYESLACFLILITLLILHKIRFNKTIPHASCLMPHAFTPGAIFLTMIILYTPFRFLNEFLRLDTQPEFLTLRLGQWVSGGLLIAALLLSIKKIKKTKPLVTSDLPRLASGKAGE